MNNLTAIHPEKRTAAGFTLIEVLVALVILSVGLLGIAGMISVSLKSSGSTYTRTQATALTYNILDRMRANRASVSSYNIAQGTPATNASCLGSTANCTPADIANFDLYEWKQDLASQLPQGDGSITTTVVNNMTQITVTVYWSDARAQQALGEVSSSTNSSNVPLSKLSITTAL
ncbi:MAG TPA: type IV pilus modification protein PilV [Gammaproteobacteria bacterium]|jgi:type IV pilus assembly protein PilV|nr:type IV pilus modification protein PilV [Gammaproteobacteria bacterium]